MQVGTKPGRGEGNRLFLNRFALAVALLLSANAQADCFEDAAAYHNVNPTILKAIAKVESSYRPHIVSRNTNGSVDIGMMQINSIHLPELAKYRVDRTDLLDACKSVYTGAWILRRQIDKYGNTWEAIGTYNSATPVYRDRYAAKVKQAVADLIASGQAY